MKEFLFCQRKKNDVYRVGDKKRMIKTNDKNRSKRETKRENHKNKIIKIRRVKGCQKEKDKKNTSKIKII